MTYKEKYQQCDTLEELVEKVKTDSYIALCVNVDRIKSIQVAMNEVVEEKGWKKGITWT